MFQRDEARRLRKSLGQALGLVSYNSVGVDGKLWIYIHMVTSYIHIQYMYIIFSLFATYLFISAWESSILKTKKLFSAANSNAFI